MYYHGEFEARGKIPDSPSEFSNTQTTSQTPASTTTQAENRMGSKKKSLTFAPAITDCWNANSTSSADYGNTSAFEYPERASCLFCCNLVIIPNNSESDKGNEKRSRMLKNLTFHMKLSSKDIPEQCSRTTFPFCKVCEEFVKQLWDFQGMLDKIKLKMSKLVTTIERTVVDAEILHPKVNVNFHQHQKLVKLREMILQEYREKLLVKQRREANLVLDNPVSGLEPIVKLERNDEACFDEQTLNSNRCPTSDEIKNLSYIRESNFIEEVDILEEFRIPEEISSTSSVSSPNMLEQDSMEIVPFHKMGQNQQHLIYKDNAEESFQNEQGDNPNLKQNCTLVISSVRGSNGSYSTEEISSLGRIKQEIHNYYETEEEIEVDMKGYAKSDVSHQREAVPEDDVYMLQPRKRRLLFEGVEIYKCTSSGSGLEYLQCSLCNHTLEIPRRVSVGDVTAFTKLKIHIQMVHLPAISSRIQPTSKRSHETIPCNQTFRNTESFQPHKTAQQEKKHVHKNLLKNFEERLAATERDIHRALLSKRSRVKMPRSKSKSSHSFGSPTNVKESSTELNCEICNRKFLRKCYLILHMRVHSTQMRWPHENVQEEQHNEGDTKPSIVQQVPEVTQLPDKRKIERVKYDSNAPA